MDTNQLIKAVGEAAGNTKPPQEYCLFWIDHWSTCMTKGEWSGWAQFTGAIAALALAIFLPIVSSRRTQRQHFRLAQANITQLVDILDTMLEAGGGMGYANAFAHVRVAIKAMLDSCRQVAIWELPVNGLDHWNTAILVAEQIHYLSMDKPLGADIGFRKMIEDRLEAVQESLEKFEKYEPKSIWQHIAPRALLKFLCNKIHP